MCPGAAVGEPAAGTGGPQGGFPVKRDRRAAEEPLLCLEPVERWPVLDFQGAAGFWWIQFWVL